jgi:hypothetical protein
VDQQPTPSDPPVAVQKDRPRWSVVLLWIGVLVFIVYPLSTGPVVWLAHKHPAINDTFHVIYAPVEELVSISPPLENTFWKYMHLWGSLED